MSVKIAFEYDQPNDVVIIRPSGKLESEEDIRSWLEQYEAYFTANFDRKVDAILDLSNVTLDPLIGSRFGATRAEIIQRFFQHSYRVRPAADTKIFMRTSYVLHGATDNEYSSVEAAMTALRDDRAKDG